MAGRGFALLFWLHLLLFLLLLLPSSDSSACIPSADNSSSNELCKEWLQRNNSFCRDPKYTPHCQQDRRTLRFAAVCARVINCSQGTYSRVNEKNCSVVCEPCHADHFQAHQKSSHEFKHPECDEDRHRCNQATKVTCLGGLPGQDDRCRCRWEAGFRPEEGSCQSDCYTELDRRCGRCVPASCPPGHRLNSTFQCAPEQCPEVPSNSSDGRRGAVITLAVILAVLVAAVVIYRLRRWIAQGDGKSFIT